MILSRDLSIPLENAFLLGTAIQGCLALLCGGYSILSIKERNWRSAAAAVLLSVVVIVAWLPVAMWVRIHTGLGVVAMGGGKYWMRQAVNANDPAAAEQIARNVFYSSIKGVHAADWGAQSIQDPVKRRQAFLLLKQVAPPGSSWRDTFQRSADEAAAASR